MEIRFAKSVGEVWEHLASDVVYLLLNVRSGRCFILSDPRGFHGSSRFFNCDPNTLTYRRIA